jgi:hypothetical protein
MKKADGVEEMKKPLGKSLKHCIVGQIFDDAKPCACVCLPQHGNYWSHTACTGL